MSSPKTKAGDRAISLPPEGVAALRRQKIQQTEWRLKAGQRWQETGLVFSGTLGGPLHRTTVSHAMWRTCQRLDLRAFSPHGLRHLHASLLLEQGLAVPVVSARLGHSHPSITMAVYAHVVGNGDRQAAEAIGKALARR